MWPRSTSSSGQPPSSRASRPSNGSSSSSSLTYQPYAAAQAPYYAVASSSTAAPTGYYAAIPDSSQPSYPVTGSDPRFGAVSAQYPPTMVARYPTPQACPSAPAPISEQDFDTFLKTGFVPNPMFSQVLPATQPASSSGRSSSSSRSSAAAPQADYVASSSQSGVRRGSELDDPWEEMNRYCRCPDRTKKPLRHWETVCSYNPSKQKFYCDLTGCTNRQGFKTKGSLERHQKTVLH
ncbi:hypothetical protein M407DRAFT_19366 [Tulasnella calospora MUT 4182]|uniref:Uncharacterized protein n=1 Tax=Tulasnella calospora MUT 4182 TaxID=1051891 RepID=A0A0C3QTN0_9AGAM|nr:hypothetical protein M407DRAFT_19366 [Tulasnella calospora MUT 4182]